MNPVLDKPAPQLDEGGIFFQPFRDGGVFALAGEAQQVRRFAVRGAGVTTFAQFFGVAIQILSTLILARILVPADFGIVAMVTTFSLLFMNAGGNGFTEAILQRQEIDRFLASNLFWVNVGTGLVLTLAFAAAGSLMAKFYGNPRVTLVAAALSLTILATSISVVHLALLMRAMRFTVVYANQVFASLLSVSCSILLAYRGWGYWALVCGAIVQPVFQCAGAWIFCHWIPSPPRPVTATWSMIRYAIKVYGRFSFNYFARNVDNLLVGWRFNAQPLGFYKKAYDLFAFSSIMQSFTPVAVSALSRLAHDAQQYKKDLLSALSVWTFLGMGTGGILTLAGKDIIRVLLGANWGPAGEIFTFFGPGFGLVFIYGIHGWIHLSIGTPGRWLRWGIFEFAVTLLMFLVALRWGPVGIASAWSVSLFILTIPALRYAGKPIDLGIAPIIAAVWRFMIAALAAGALSAVICRGLHFTEFATTLTEALVRVVAMSITFGVLYTVSVAALHGSWAPINQVVGLAREMIPAWSPPRTSAAAPLQCKQ